MMDSKDNFKEKFKNTLEQDLAPFTFTTQQQAKVLKYTHPRNIRGKISGILNREIEIPIVYLVLPVLLFILPINYITHFDKAASNSKNSLKNQELIVLPTGTFYKSQLESLVKGSKGGNAFEN